jgi:hypothetical protein
MTGLRKCSPSQSQAPHASAVVGGNADNVRFINTLAGEPEPFTGATLRDAAQWAACFGLDRSWVIIEGHSTPTIPQHTLIGGGAPKEQALNHPYRNSSACLPLRRRWAVYVID